MPSSSGLKRCLRFGGAHVDATVADEIRRVVEPMAIEASLEAARMQMMGLCERQQLAELDQQQARYEASLAERRYAARDPDNRLIAAELEKTWKTSAARPSPHQRDQIVLGYREAGLPRNLSPYLPEAFAPLLQ